MTSRRRLVTLILLLTLVGGSPNDHLQPEGGAHEIRLVDETGSPRQRPAIVEVFQWSIDRFAQLGLAIQPDSVTFHRGRTECALHGGLWTMGRERSRIDICVGGTSQRKQMLLHEMAHDWIARHLDQDERDAFVERRGLEGWSGLSMDWADRGTEQAAMIIAWGLADRCETPTSLGVVDEKTLAEEFRRLTERTHLCGSH